MKDLESQTESEDLDSGESVPKINTKSRRGRPKKYIDDSEVLSILGESADLDFSDVTKKRMYFNKLQVLAFKQLVKKIQLGSSTDIKIALEITELYTPKAGKQEEELEKLTLEEKRKRISKILNELGTKQSDSKDVPSEVKG